MHPTFLIAIVAVCSVIIAISVYYGLKKSVVSRPHNTPRVWENYSPQNREEAIKSKEPKTVEEYTCTYCK